MLSMLCSRRNADRARTELFQNAKSASRHIFQVLGGTVAGCGYISRESCSTKCASVLTCATSTEPCVSNLGSLHYRAWYTNQRPASNSKHLPLQSSRQCSGALRQRTP